jgi:hypothetical protein
LRCVVSFGNPSFRCSAEQFRHDRIFDVSRSKQSNCDSTLVRLNYRVELPRNRRSILPDRNTRRVTSGSAFEAGWLEASMVDRKREIRSRAGLLCGWVSGFEYFLDLRSVASFQSFEVPRCCPIREYWSAEFAPSWAFGSVRDFRGRAIDDLGKNLTRPSQEPHLGYNAPRFRYRSFADGV